MRRVRLSIVQQQIIFTVVRATVILSQNVFQAYPFDIQTIIVVAVWRIEDSLYVLIHGTLLLLSKCCAGGVAQQGETHSDALLARIHPDFTMPFRLEAVTTSISR